MPRRSGSLGNEGSDGEGGGGVARDADAGSSLDAMAWTDIGAWRRMPGRPRRASWAAPRSRTSLDRGRDARGAAFGGVRPFRNGATASLELRLDAVDQERADFAERAKLGGVAEPAAGVGFGRGSAIGYAFVRDAGEAGVAEERGPFV